MSSFQDRFSKESTEMAPGKPMEDGAKTYENDMKPPTEEKSLNGGVPTSPTENLLDQVEELRQMFPRDRENHPPLCYQEDIPLPLQRPYITSHYLYGTSHAGCIKGAFTCCHNESLNIWTDVIASAQNIISAVIDIRRAMKAKNVGIGQLWHLEGPVLALAISKLSFAGCKTFSFLAHMFGGRSVVSHDFWYSLDFAGLCLTVAGSTPAAVATGDYPRRIPPYLYLMTTLIIARRCLKILLGTTDNSNSNSKVSNQSAEEAKRQHDMAAMKRLVSLGLFFFIALYPNFRRMLRYVGHGNANSDMGNFPLAVKSFGLIVAAAAIYIIRFPERFAPRGKFDLFLYSHCIWHVLANVSLAYWHKYVAKDLGVSKATPLGSMLARNHVNGLLSPALLRNFTVVLYGVMGYLVHSSFGRYKSDLVNEKEIDEHHKVPRKDAK